MNQTIKTKNFSGTRKIRKPQYDKCVIYFLQYNVSVGRVTLFTNGDVAVYAIK